MRVWQIVLVLSFTAQGAAGRTQTNSSRPVPTTRQLSGLSSEDAAALIAKLQGAQRRLKGGEFQSFELLAGSIASNDKTNLAPRKAFLQIPFERVWNIERVRGDNPLWQPYKLAYAPQGLGQLYWDIEVVLDINGDVQRVLMIYKPPAPF